MKAKTQKQITLEEIAHALDTHPLSDARALLADRIGAQLKVSGIILKIAKRDEVKLIVKAEAGNRSFEILATLTAAEGKKIIDAKIKKNASIALTGKFQSFGTHAIALIDCWQES